MASKGATVDDFASNLLEALGYDAKHRTILT
jgi:hypothetical protein